MAREMNLSMGAFCRAVTRIRRARGQPGGIPGMGASTGGRASDHEGATTEPRERRLLPELKVFSASKLGDKSWGGQPLLAAARGGERTR